MGKGTASTGHGSLASGAVTALAIAVQSGLAAVVGWSSPRELGRTAETDGFFAAYAVFVVLALAATAIRVTLTAAACPGTSCRAAFGGDGGLRSQRSRCLGLPLLLVGVLAARPIADVLTGSGPGRRRCRCRGTPWMIVAGLGQFTAALLASTLAALDDYVVAAGGSSWAVLRGLR